MGVEDREKDSDKGNGFTMPNFPGYTSDICWQPITQQSPSVLATHNQYSFHSILQNFQGTNYDT